MSHVHNKNTQQLSVAHSAKSLPFPIGALIKQKKSVAPSINSFLLLMNEFFSA
jgi:hypothetical protein